MSRSHTSQPSGAGFRALSAGSGRVARAAALVATTALCLLLAACGATSGSGQETPEPVPPAIHALSTDIAAHGEGVVISGGNFGSGGTVEIGGVPVATSSWSDTEVELIIPTDAPAGPRELTLQTEHGSDSSGLFIGVAFPVGALEDLAAMNLPRGTAVRLEAGVYPATDPGIIALDNLSLFGQGAEHTVLDFDPGTWLQLFVDHGHHAVLSDLTILVDSFAFGPSPVSGTLDAVSTSMTIRNSAIRDDLGGIYTATSLLTGDSFPGDLILEGAEIIGLDTTVFLGVPGRVTVTGSTVRAGAELVLGSASDHLEVIDSLVATQPFGESILVGARGLTLTGSHFEAGLGMDVWGALPDPLLEASGPSFLQGNAFESSVITMYFAFAPALLEHNTFTAAGILEISATNAQVEATDNEIALGAAAAPSPELYLVGRGSHAHLGFRRNSVTFTGAGTTCLCGNHAFVMTDNVVEGDSGTGYALVLVQEHLDRPFDATVTGNVFHDFEHALAFHGGGPGAEPFTASISHNVFDFVIDAAPKVAEIWGMVEAELDGRHNVWGGNTDVAVVESYIDLHAPSTVTLTVDPIAQP